MNTFLNTINEQEVTPKSQNIQESSSNLGSELIAYLYMQVEKMIELNHLNTVE